jgi:hypothetical protein
MTSKAKKVPPRPAASADEVSELELQSGRFRRLGPGKHAGKRITVPLSDVRTASGKTQVAIAEASNMQQADVSRLERRTNYDDVLIGTLRRYARALGGELELAVIVNGDRIVVRTEERAKLVRSRAKG